MFLFIVSLRAPKPNKFSFYDPTDPEVKSDGIEDHNPKNVNELRKHIRNILDGYDNVDSVVGKAQFANINKIEFNFGPEVAKIEEGGVFHRFFTLKAVFLRSIKNKDGSFNVRHYTMTVTKNIWKIKMPYCWIHRSPAGTPYLLDPWSYLLMNKIDVAEMYNEMRAVLNKQITEIIGSFKFL